MAESRGIDSWWHTCGIMWCMAGDKRTMQGPIDMHPFKDIIEPPSMDTDPAGRYRNMLSMMDPKDRPAAIEALKKKGKL